MGENFSLTPLLYKILNVYVKVTTDDDDIVVVSMKEAMYHDLNGRYHGINVWY